MLRFNIFTNICNLSILVGTQGIDYVNILLGYEAMDESKMEPPQADIMKAPPLPRRSKSMQQIKRHRSPVARVITWNSIDGVAFDINSGHENVANQIQKHDKSAVWNQITKDLGEQHFENCGHKRVCKAQQKQPNTTGNTTSATDADDGNVRTSDASPLNKSISAFNKSMRLTQSVAIRDPKQSHSARTFMISQGNMYARGSDAFKGRNENNDNNQGLFKCNEPSKETARAHLVSAESITHTGKSQQDIRYSHSGNKTSHGYQQLNKETMESISNKHEYQKLNKLTMEPRLLAIVNTERKPQCSGIGAIQFRQKMETKQIMNE